MAAGGQLILADTDAPPHADWLGESELPQADSNSPGSIDATMSAQSRSFDVCMAFSGGIGVNGYARHVPIDAVHLNDGAENTDGL